MIDELKLRKSIKYKKAKFYNLISNKLNKYYKKFSINCIY